MAALFVVILWIPVFALLISTLWINQKSLQYIRAQKAVDRCLYGLQAKRCQNLTNISTLNQQLHTLLKVAAGLKASLIIPGAGEALQIAFKTVQSQMKIIATLQDLAKNTDTFYLSKTLQCGVPLGLLESLHIERPHHPLADTLGVPSPLTMQDMTPLGLHLRGWAGQQAFGYCHARSPVLHGEHYFVTFRYPQSHTVHEDKSFSRSLLSWQF